MKSGIDYKFSSEQITIYKEYCISQQIKKQALYYATS